MKLLLIIFCFVSFQISFSQIILKGSVTDIHDSKGLHNAIIKEKAHREYCFTDSNGSFTLKIDHPGIHTFTISHPGCKKNVISITILSDTFIYFYLDHQENTTKKITITGSKSYTPNEQVLIHDIGKDIGTRIQELQGAALMQTGSNINKPMINGMHSQRLIMNFDNMRFESQQWGSEHAPEIDPNAVYKARLIQGSEALQYGSEGISGIIKLEPNYLIQNNKKFSGSLKTGFATNGNKFFGALDLKGTLKNFHYFIQTSSSKQGNLLAPNYYLMNTGLEELNFNTGISFKIKKINISSYYSRFYNNLGVLSASHIGNIDDLQEAIKRGNPIDKGNFSYTINVPSQKVFHEIIKTSIEIPFKKNKLNIDISNQYNIRNEYDFVLQIANKEKPVSNLILSTQQFQSIYTIPIRDGHWALSGGTTLQNNNYGGTFLIPKYRTLKYNAYVYLDKKIHPKWQIIGILRYDGEDRKIFDRTIDSVILEKKYGDISSSIDFNFTPKENNEHKFQFVQGWRPPHIVELYSNGVHHGAASYEIGNDSINKERSFGFNYNFTWKNSKFVLISNPYIYYFPNYISLISTQELTQTIRGFFPTWQYQQSKVLYYGFNFGMTYQIISSLNLEYKFQSIKIDNFQNGYSLQNTPQNSMLLKLKYRNKLPKKNQILEMSISGQYFLKRNDINPLIDYALPPEAYTMVNFNLGYHFKELKLPLSIEFSIQNLLNAAFRSYTDRLRYFADSKGIDFQIKTYLNF